MSALLVSLIFIILAGVVLSLHNSGLRPIQIAGTSQPAQQRR